MQEYLENLEVDGRSHDYVRMVRTGLAHFEDYMRQQNIVHPDEITRAHLLRYQAYINSKTKENGDLLSVRYKQQLLKYLRGWINWLVEVGYIETNPWIRIKVGRTPKQPKPLEEEELVLLFDTHRKQAFAIPPFPFHRREIILVLLFSWGLRIHELQALNVSQMDMRLNTVMALNKGGGTKPLPYGLALKNVVQRWLVVRAKHATYGEDALLIDSHGKRLSIAMIRKIVTELGERAGLKINPHRLRDTFGTTMLDHDMEVERLMKIMGHTNRAQTLSYARINDHKVTESHNRIMSPILDTLLRGQ
jgi:site-specific recombinase XerD